VFAVGAMIAFSPSPVGAQSPGEHAAWVADELIRMQTIEPGMTRAELLEVFTTEGGISTGLRRRFVSKNCPYFKVDVEFRPVGRPARDADGRVTLVEDERDIIVTISQPYLQFSVKD
jgi:hypothetical protein